MKKTFLSLFLCGIFLMILTGCNESTVTETYHYSGDIPNDIESDIYNTISCITENDTKDTSIYTKTFNLKYEKNTNKLRYVVEISELQFFSYDSESDSIKQSIDEELMSGYNEQLTNISAINNDNQKYKGISAKVFYNETKHFITTTIVRDVQNLSDDYDYLVGSGLDDYVDSDFNFNNKEFIKYMKKNGTNCTEK